MDNEDQVKTLKGIRKKLQWSQKKTAEKFEIPLRTWEEWESGRRKMPKYLLRLICYKVETEMVIVNKNNSLKYSINIIQDENQNNIIIINDVRFKGRQNIKWKEVEILLKEYVGENYQIIETSDTVFIGPDFPGEFKGSEDTRRLKGTAAKAKANAAGEMPLLLQYATNKRWQENYKTKHGIDAKYGWYRFTTRFALPVYDNDEQLIRYNIFRIEMLVRHASDGKLYLYDMVNIKKETGTPLRN